MRNTVKRLEAIEPTLVAAMAHRLGWLAPAAAEHFYKTVASLTVEALRNIAQELGIDETFVCQVVQKHMVANVHKLNAAVCGRMSCDGNHTS